MAKKKRGYQLNSQKAQDGAANQQNLQAQGEIIKLNSTYERKILETLKNETSSDYILKIIESLSQESVILQELKDTINKINMKELYQTNHIPEVAQVLAFLYLNPKVNHIKKYIFAQIIQIEEDLILKTLESQTISYLQSQEFVSQVETLDSVIAAMRSLVYKIPLYQEVITKLGPSSMTENLNQNTTEDESTVDSASQVPKRKQTEGFLKIVLEAATAALNNYKRQNLQKMDFILNFTHIKAIVEFQHVMLNFCTKFQNNPELTYENASGFIEFCIENLNDNQTQKDLLTQSSIIFWMFVKMHSQGPRVKDFSLMIECISQNNLQEIIERGNLTQKDQVKKEDKSSVQDSLKLDVGILAMAKARGFILVFEKDIDLEKATKQTKTQAGNFLDYLILNCETNEGLSKMYSFQTLEALLCKLNQIEDSNLINQILGLVLNHLDYPLSSVATTSECVLKKLLSLSSQAQVASILDQIDRLHQNDMKARFIALNLTIEYVDPFEFLAKNKTLISEMINSTLELVTTGKYVVNFFENILTSAKAKTLGTEKKWFDLWIDQYLQALRSDNEQLRTSVNALITPIVIKINKNSLPYILSTLLLGTDSDKQLDPQVTLQSMITLLKIARQNKMIEINDDTQDIRLEKQSQESLNLLQPDLPPFEIKQADLLKLVLSSNYKTCLDCIQIVAMEVKVSESVTLFEYEMATQFIKNCLRTTFPEYRQNFIKAIKQFMIRLRTVTEKDIKKYVADGENMTQNVQRLVTFLKGIIQFIEENLYLDKPIEGSLPLFEILKMILDFFGDFEYKLKISYVFAPCYLISTAHLIESESFFIFLLNSLKSTWVLIRINAYDILSRYPQSYKLFNDKDFVNNILYATAIQQCNNPKAMMADGAALLLKLIYTKAINQLTQIDQSQSLRQMQLQFVKSLLDLIKQRLDVFQHVLIKEGKTDSLLHGLLGFFKHLFEDFKIDRNELTDQEFDDWRVFFHELLQTCLKVSKDCGFLLSGSGLATDEGGNENDVQVDCRGHPIQAAGENESTFGDYQNLILVGVWLAVKENGLTLFNLLKWVDLPSDDQDQSKFLVDKDIKELCDRFLVMLFSFKHRGAIEKAAECFCLFNQKLLQSTNKYYQEMPKKMLNEALEKISSENLSTILRRSAGIPPTIIAILRAEPISAEPQLLNLALEFLLGLAQKAKKDDSKIHALNILRYIFQDALLKHDIQRFITPGMILATESFSSDNWSIRNSALMCFTALTKRLLNTAKVQDQDLSNKKGLSIWEFLSRYTELSDYFQLKLKESFKSQLTSKEDKEKQNLVIFSILLLISRLIPSFHMVESRNESDSKNESEESKVSSGSEEQKRQEFSIAHQRKSREESIRNYVNVIAEYYQNSTYFVRKISAQAMLPLVKFDQYITEIISCFEKLNSSLEQGKKLKQNQAHGFMIRINVFAGAYFQYKGIATKANDNTTGSSSSSQQQMEAQLQQCFTKFQAKLPQFEKLYSKVIIALFVRTQNNAIQKQTQLDSNPAQISKELQGTLDFYSERFESIHQLAKDGKVISPDDQIYLKQVTKLIIVLQIKIQGHKSDQGNTQNINSFELLTKVLDTLVDDYADFAFKFLSTFNSFTSQVIIRINFIYGPIFTISYLCPYQITSHSGTDQVQKTIDYLINSVLPRLLQKQILFYFMIQIFLKIKQYNTYRDERHCKVVETVLKILHKLIKFQHKANQLGHLEITFVDQLLKIKERFNTNPNILTQLIRLEVLMLKQLIEQKLDHPQYLELIVDKLRANSFMDSKEHVRVAVTKSLKSIIPLLKLDETSYFVQSLINFKAYLKIVDTLVILLNDEQPDIRSYLISQHVTFILNTDMCQLQGSNLASLNQDHFKIDLNDQVFVEALLDDLTQFLIKFNQKDLLVAYANELLYSCYIPNLYYREHVHQNYEDKIFFYEPINKFFDLLWLKQIAFRQLSKIVETGNITSQEIQTSNGKQIIELQVNAKEAIEQYYGKDKIMNQSSFLFEQVVESALCESLSGRQVPTDGLNVDSYLIKTLRLNDNQ